VLKPYLIRQTVTHIKKNVCTTRSIARVMDLHDGFNVCGSDHLRRVEPAYSRGESRGERVLWSSSSVKKEHRDIEKIIQEDINFTVINNKFKNKHVNEVGFTLLTNCSVTLFTTSEIHVTITVDGAPLDDHCGRVKI
jgi:hypothetical protein